MLKLHTKLLCSALSETKGTPVGTGIAGLNPHLREVLIEPFLAGRVVRAGEINFAAFTLDNLADIEQCLSNMISNSNLLRNLTVSFRKAIPAASKSAAYC